MSTPRFFQPNLPHEGIVALSTEDSKHAATVLRLRVSDRLQLFDGSGLLADAEITSCSKTQVEVRVLSSCMQNVSTQNLKLIVALPKGDRQKQLVDQLVQLGVDELVPLVSHRAVVQPHASALPRLQRTVIETCKQCGRNRLMRIGEPIAIEKLATNVETVQPVHRIFAHPYGDSKPIAELLDLSSHTWPIDACVVVGPEGGLTDQECDMLVNSGWLQASLGETILRIETAAVMVAAIWASRKKTSDLSSARDERDAES